MHQVPEILSGLLEIHICKLKAALKSLRNQRAPVEDRTTVEVLKIEEGAETREITYLSI